MADTQKSGSGTLIFALAVAAIGGALVGWVGRDLTADPAPQPSLTSMLSEPAQDVAPPPTAEAIAAAESEIVRTQETIIKGCIAELRDYSERLTGISDIAEAEGSTTAATQMREFRKEITDKLAGFDRITNQ